MTITLNLNISPTVCFAHCSCTTNVHPISASGDDEVYHMSVSKALMRSGGVLCIILFEHGLGHYQIELSA